MTAQEKIAALYHALSQRRIGNTTLMIQGAAHYDRPFALVGSTMQYAKDLAKANKNAYPCTLQAIEKATNGTSIPICVDHHVLVESLGAALDNFHSQSVQINAQRSALVELKTKVYNLSQDEVRYHVQSSQFERAKIKHMRDIWFMEDFIAQWLDVLTFIGLSVIALAGAVLLYAFFG